METKNVESDPPRFARDLLVGFIALCQRTGLDGLLHELGLTGDPDDRPELQPALATRLGTKAEFDPRGPRNAKPKQAVDCLLAALGVTVGEELAPTAIPGDVRAAIAAAFTEVMTRELAVPKARTAIVAWARSRVAEEQWTSYEKYVAGLDDYGMKLLKQPKIPLHVEQAIAEQLALARVHVFERVVNAALDRAKPLLAAANAEAAERIDQPITLTLTPRAVAIQRAAESSASPQPEAIARTLLTDLAELARLSWLTVEKVARPYSASQTFAVGDVIEHPKFGRVTVLGAALQRVEVELADGSKVALVHAKK